MKTKEKLERAGYIYFHSAHGRDYYMKGKLVILIDTETKEAVAYYRRGSNQLILINDEILEDLLCQ